MWPPDERVATSKQVVRGESQGSFKRPLDILMDENDGWMEIMGMLLKETATCTPDDSLQLLLFFYVFMLLDWQQ